MKYQGSKRRLAKQFLPTILSGRSPGQYYVEPFVGGANMLEHVTGLRIAADSNQYLIALLSAIRDGWEPPQTLSEEEYKDIKTNMGRHAPELAAFAGILCSFGSKWFGGYARDKKGSNYASMGCRALAKQAPKIQGVDFRHCEYSALEIPNNSIIYCDPPYKATEKYRDQEFDNEAFMQWALSKSEEGHKVYVSEGSEDDRFDILHRVELNTTSCGNRHKPRTELLMAPKGQ